MGKNQNELVKRILLLKGNMSGVKFANRCGMPVKTIRNYLNEKRSPSTESIQRIAEAFNVPLDWLVSGKLPSSTEMNVDQLRAFFTLDPEVIDVQEDERGVYPVVRAYDNLSSQLYYYCIHCMRFHSVGRGGREEPYRTGRLGKWEGHCIATNSPFTKTGIILEIVGTDEEHQAEYKKQDVLCCPKCHEYYSGAFNACSCGFVNLERRSLYPDLEHEYQRSYLIEPVLGIKASNDPELAREHNRGTLPSPPLRDIPPPQPRSRVIPLLGSVPAGFPSRIEDYTIGWEPVDDSVPSNSYALQVRGNSMRSPDGDGIHDGDIVFFVHDIEPRHNDVVVVNDEFGDPMLKRIKRVPEDGTFVLTSDNPDYPPIKPNGEYYIVGVVFDARRKIRVRR